MTTSDGFSFGRHGQGPLVEWQQHYRLDDGKLSHGLGTALPPLVADLIDIAVAVYVTDRLHPRRPPYGKHDGSHWERHLSAEIALRCHDVWRQPDTLATLHDLLTWLTDDSWSIAISANGPELARHSEMQRTLFDEPLAQPAQVSLMSGGLDSLLGAVADSEGPGELLLVSTATHSKLGHLQGEIARGLMRRERRTVRHLAVPINLTQSGKDLVPGREESSQRTRAFVFMALGAAAALTAGCRELRVYENGPGALNLHQTAGQRGAMTTRAMRPETLQLMSRLISSATAQPFEIVNPNFWLTKAEMCRRAPSDIDGLIAVSRSCDTALIGRRSRDAPCGTCTSCVLRRQALLAGRRPGLDAQDVELMNGDSLRANQPGITDDALRLMLTQVHSLSRCLESADPWAALVTKWPDLVSARRALNVSPEPLVDLLQRYRDEWASLPYGVVDRMLTG
jgi:7-cyano-7-deazaguanine synthase in queuosine biosynthesis